MSEELARLKAAATSDDLYERAAAAERLVPFADQPDVSELLLRLLLDDRDPYVTMRTSGALLEREDALAWRLYVQGYSNASERQRDWYQLPTWLPPSVQTMLDELLAEADEDVAAAGRTLISRIEQGDTQASGWREQLADERERGWDAFDERFSFRASTRPEDWPAIREPQPSITIDLSPIFGSPGPRFASGMAAVNEEALRSFVWTFHVSEELCVLDWKHPSYWFTPGLHAMSYEPHWRVPVFPNGDYYVFLRKDQSAGTFGHPWEQTLCIFGQELIDSLATSLRTWLPVLRVDGQPV